ncbi:hypothetical protein [Caulobacter sp. 17J65-9]|uniref:hypothetical protein n=1 Tax=Caulobacter sp. 17J65-9 TaxID=2709382 RepID=UPI0013C72056|nr:hypothetical protein [Caulobacter sp. 17J65-9]NEX93795.1 hypothetical protein [Caulobacter sp. 17J65-9]
MTPEEIEARRRLLERRLAYNRELNRAGGKWEAGAWVFTLLGLVSVVGRRFDLADFKTLWWLGMVALVAALACWVVVFMRRKKWREEHPFDPEGRS